MSSPSTINLTLSEETNLNEQENETKFKNLSFHNKLLYIKNIITVEPVLCLYILPAFIAPIAVQNLQIQMACRVNLQFNDTICSDLLSLNNKNYEKDVQIQVTEMIPWKTPLSTAIPSILVLFFGSYSDRHKKRKPFLIMPLFGEFISTICFMFCVLNITKWPMEVAGVAESLFPALTGSLTIMMMSVYSYIAEVTNLETRTFRIGLVHIIAAAVAPIGYLLSGVLFENIGFYGVFTISLLLFTLAFFYAIFYVKEPRTIVSNLPKRNLCVDLFDPKHIVETIVAVFKKRKGTERLRIILLMLTFIVILGPSNGEAVITFFFTRTQFQWGSIEYSLYSVYDIVIHLIGSITAISLFSQYLQLDDLLLAIIACSSKVAASFFYAFSKTSTLFYIAPIVSIFSGSGTIAMRSIATKLVDQNDVGKIQSLFGICEGLAPLIYSSMYSHLYIATINTLPGAFYLFGAALISPAIFIFLVMYILQKRDAAKSIENNNKPDLFKYTIPITET